MNGRVSASEVKEIMGSMSVDDAVVGVMIETANRYVNKVFSGDATMSEDDLKDVERWLAAHMIAISLSRQTTEEKVGDASAVYAGKFGEGLASTSYGQMVLALDLTGKLAKASKRQASIFAVIHEEWDSKQ